MSSVRSTLKKYFGPNSRPTAQHFEQLIDSALIMDDEGFRKTSKDGLRITSAAESHALVSFLRHNSNNPEWSINFRDDGVAHLSVNRGPFDSKQSPILTFSDFGSNVGIGPHSPSAIPPQIEIVADVGIRTEEPTSGIALDVGGVLRANGRVGRQWQVPADGEAHPISDALQGCHAFEVMAGVNDQPDSGRYALLHAFAMNVFNPSPWDNWFRLKKRIRMQHAWYDRRGDRLLLTWQPCANPDPNGPVAAKYGRDAWFQLMLQSRNAYIDADGNVATITAFVSQLWHDPHMNGSFGKTSRARPTGAG